MSLIRDKVIGVVTYADQSLIHPLSFVLTCICVVWLMTCKRRHLLFPILIVVCFITAAQRISILTIDFPMLRIMVMFGLLRIWLKLEHVGFVVHMLDKWVVAALVSRMLVQTILIHTSSIVVYEFSQFLDIVGLYFILRCSIKSYEDFESSAKIIAIFALPVAVFFVIENTTGRNFFSVLGGVNEFTRVRNGEIRATGVFSHPIIAGAFWASLFPVVIASYWSKNRSVALSVLGGAACVTIILACSSSTPVFGLLFGIIGAGWFRYRKHVPLVRWCTIATLIALHIVMAAPVWHLITRVKTVGGSTAFFRYQMIDSAVNHFNEWWLIGTRSTAHWFYGAQDITNHFVYMGVKGGAITLLLFCISLGVAFKSVGEATRIVKYRRVKIHIWLLGASLFAHCGNFIGVSYFGQGKVALYFTLAAIASMHVAVKKEQIKEGKLSKVK